MQSVISRWFAKEFSKWQIENRSRVLTLVPCEPMTAKGMMVGWQERRWELKCQISAYILYDENHFWFLYPRVVSLSFDSFFILNLDIVNSWLLRVVMFCFTKKREDCRIYFAISVVIVALIAFPLVRQFHSIFLYTVSLVSCCVGDDNKHWVTFALLVQSHHAVFFFKWW
jgi:hypothetical protein